MQAVVGSSKTGGNTYYILNQLKIICDLCRGFYCINVSGRAEIVYIDNITNFAIEIVQRGNTGGIYWRFISSGAIPHNAEQIVMEKIKASRRFAEIILYDYCSGCSIYEMFVEYKNHILRSRPKL